MQGNYGNEACKTIAWHLDNIVEVNDTFRIKVTSKVPNSYKIMQQLI
jgi:hypothetical protein